MSARSSFEEMVRADMFSDTPDQSLRTPSMVAQWAHYLHESVQSIDRQLDSARQDADNDLADLQAGQLTVDEHDRICAERRRWKSKALVFQYKAARRLREAQALQVSFDSAQSARLLAAISEHRAACELEGIEPEPHDLVLWELVGS